jgi:hypothetical protein
MIGAERDSNIIKAFIDLQGNGVSSFPYDKVTPFAKTNEDALAVAWVDDERIRVLSDPLIQFSYLSEFPINPFARRDTGMWNSSTLENTTMTGVFPYGGFHGDKMFDLSFGYGDTPQTDFVLYTTEDIEEREAAGDDDLYADPDLDSPGNFYYHPLFNDRIPVYFHYAANFGATMNIAGTVPWSSIGIISDEAEGYLLYGYGAAGDRDSNVEGGLDYFNRMPDYDDMPDDVTDIMNDFNGVRLIRANIGQGDTHLRVESTGYPSSEYDPWTGSFADGINPQNPGEILQYRKSGADGVLDWVIIEVSSGVDVKSDTVKDALQFAT